MGAAGVNVGARIGASAAGHTVPGIVMAAGAIAGVAAGAALGTMGRDDGTRRVHRRYASDYTLRPRSKEAARDSKRLQIFQSIGAIGIGVVVGVGALATKGRGWDLGNVGMAAVGAGLIGHGASSAWKLRDLDDGIDPGLPEHTPDGEADMVRTDPFYPAYGLRPIRAGRGYSVLGFPTGAAADGRTNPSGAGMASLASVSAPPAFLERINQAAGLQLPPSPT